MESTHVLPFGNRKLEEKRERERKKKVKKDRILEQIKREKKNNNNNKPHNQTMSPIKRASTRGRVG